MKSVTLQRHSLKRGAPQIAPVQIQPCIITGGPDVDTVSLSGRDVDGRRYTLTLNPEAIAAVACFALSAIETPLTQAAREAVRARFSPEVLKQSA